MGSAVFSPASLFANGEQGVWYDPSDLSTLFQDTVGTTPVTTAGQTVGLMLDKSQGLTLGPELVTNGGFDDGLTGWVLNANATGKATVVDGVLTYSAPHGDYAEVKQLEKTIIGKTYRVSYEITSKVGTIESVIINCGRTQIFNGPIANIPLGVTTATVKSSHPDGFSISVRTDGQIAIDNISVKELPGYHAAQPTTAARPTYQTDGTYHWLSFDGVDDFMVTPTITPGIDKAQVFAGVRKLSDATTGVLLEHSSNAASNAGSFYISAPDIASGNYGFRSGGNLLPTSTIVSGYSSPVTSVVSSLMDISSDTLTARIDGTQVAQSTGDQGTGNYLAYPIYIGRRGGTSFPFTGNIYSLVTRFGANLETATIETTETYVAGKTGVTL